MPDEEIGPADDAVRQEETVGPLIDPTLDRLEPPAIGSIIPLSPALRVRWLYGENSVAWTADERALFLFVNPPGKEWRLVRWDLGGEPHVLLRPDQIPISDRRTAVRPSRLVTEPGGARLAFAVGSAGEKEQYVWCVFDTRSGAVHCSPPNRGVVCGWSGDSVVGIAQAKWLGGAADQDRWKARRAGADWQPPSDFEAAECLAWKVGDPSPPRPFVTGGRVRNEYELSASPGTLVAHAWTGSGWEVRFHRECEALPYATRSVPAGVRACPAFGGRIVLVVNRGGWEFGIPSCGDHERFVLVDARRDLAEASEPPSGYSRERPFWPCPSGRVVARTESPRVVRLVDLRDGTLRDVHLEHEAAGSDLYWSPSGRALAIPSKEDVLQVLDAGLGIQGTAPPFSGRVEVVHMALKRKLERYQRDLRCPDSGSEVAVPLARLIEALTRAIDEAKARGPDLEETCARFSRALGKIDLQTDPVAPIFTPERDGGMWRVPPGEFVPPFATRVGVLVASLEVDEVLELVGRAARRAGLEAMASLFRTFGLPPPEETRRVWRSLGFPITSRSFVEALCRAWTEAIGGTIAGEEAETSQQALDRRLGPPEPGPNAHCPRCGDFDFQITYIPANGWVPDDEIRDCSACGFYEDTR